MSSTICLRGFAGCGREAAVAVFCTVLAVSLLTAPVSGAAGERRFSESGFLLSYQWLGELEGQPGNYFYADFDFDPGKYAFLILDDTEVRLSDESRYRGIRTGELSGIVESFRETLEEKLGAEFELTDLGGEEVAILRVAITDVLANDPRLVTDYQKLYGRYTTYREALGKRLLNLSRTGLEAELLDPATKKQLLAIVLAPPRGRPSTMEDLTVRLTRVLQMAFGRE